MGKTSKDKDNTLVGILYSWGRNDSGQLAQGKEDPEVEGDVLSPVQVDTSKTLQNKLVTSVACSPFHTVLVTSEGDLFMSGDNSKGQLDPKEELDAFKKKPEQVNLALPPAVKVVKVACGLYHTACLTNDGHVITFGSNQYGQLGHSHDRAPNRVMARIVEGISRRNIIQVACTDYSTVMLSRFGKVYTCGAGMKGVLGLGSIDNESDARAVGGAIEGIPICHISAGSSHCISISVSGSAYAWGQNANGELGVGITATPEGYSSLPLKVRLPAPVRSSSCGEAHTVFVGVTGNVYTCGSNSYGQLGLNDVKSLEYPEVVDSLEVLKVVQSACGSGHTCLLGENGEVYMYGYGKNGQIGDGKGAEKLSSPTKINISSDVSELFAGGESTFAISLKSQGIDSRAYRYRSTINGFIGAEFGLSVAKLREFCKLYATLSEKVKEKTFVKVATTMLDMNSLNASFLQPEAHIPHSLYESLEASELHGSSMTRVLKRFQSDESMLNVESMLREQANFVENVLNKASDKIKTNFRVRVASVIANLDRAAPQVQDKEQLRAYFVLLISPFMDITPREHEALVMTIQRLPESSKEILYGWISREQPTLYFNEYILKRLIGHLDKHLKFFKFTGQAVAMCQMLNKLHSIRHVANLEDVPNAFYTKEPSDWDERTLQGLYRRWRATEIEDRATVPEFALFTYPFLLGADIKRRLLHIEDMYSQQQHATMAVFNYQNPFLILEVDRNAIYLETLNRIEEIELRSVSDLRRPLRIKFKGEEGLDAGGVKKEFFQLISPELFSVDLFRVISSTNQLWFNRSAFNDENARRYELVGLMMGLAIYNDTLLDVQFPITLYEMLLNKFPEHPTIRDMERFDPDIAKNLKYILEIDEKQDLEDLALNFVITEEVFGEFLTHELCPGGNDKEVTLSNREEYIRLYIEYVILGPPHQRYQNWLIKGFRKLIPLELPVMSLFEPSELELVLVGTPELDFTALERRCAYEGGYDANSKSIKRFWKIIQGLTYEQKRLFLKFATGSPRAPVGGLETQNFKVQRAGPDSNQLPTAHTCFNTLMLPDYSSEAKMRKLLLLAIENCEGFGLE